LFSSVCPSCGAPVSFKASTSTTAICGFCKSTLARDQDTLRLIGTQGELLEDYSRIQLGTSGTALNVKNEKQTFTVIGRIQLRFEQGFWNEWYLLYNDGKAGWLSDASGQYALMNEIGSYPGAAAFDSVKPGQAVRINSQVFVVSDKREALCLGGQGELPFAPTSSWTAKTIDLRFDDQLVTLDYSDSATPVIYRGQSTSFEQLDLKLLRAVKDQFTDTAVAGKLNPKSVQTLNCKHCGSGIKLPSALISKVICPSCTSELSAAPDGLVLEVQRANRNIRQTTLMPGDEGALGGVKWLVLGVLIRRAVGDEETWQEYLLYEANRGFEWLVEAQGVWQRFKAMDRIPQVQGGSAQLDNKNYQAQEPYTAAIAYAAGSFNWKVKVGDQVDVAEFKGGDETLSRETNNNEETWSRGTNISAKEVLIAFGKMDPTASIAASRNANDSSIADLAWIFGGILLLVTGPAWFSSTHPGPVGPVFFGVIALILPLIFLNGMK
jgi:Domain of unknown function (DUF4178)